MPSSRGSLASDRNSSGLSNDSTLTSSGYSVSIIGNRGNLSIHSTSNSNSNTTTDRDVQQHSPHPKATTSTRSMLSTTSSTAASTATQGQQFPSRLYRRMADHRSNYASDRPERRDSVFFRFHYSRNSINGGLANSVESNSQNQRTGTNSSLFEIVQWYSKIPILNVVFNHVARRTFLAWILYSAPWRVLLVVLSFILLFGPPIQNMVIPPKADLACDGIYILTFSLFTLDILMRIDVEDNYFMFRLCGYSIVPCNSTVTENNATTSRHSIYNERNKSKDRNRQYMPSTGCCCNVVIGSFLFWCDVISAITLLYAISLIKNVNNQQININIVLNQFGIPVSGISSINDYVLVGTEVSLYGIVGRTARVARFIRSTSAVKLSSKVNWFWLVNLFNPFWWWFKVHLFLRVRRNERGKKINQKSVKQLNANETSESFNKTNNSISKSSHIHSNKSSFSRQTVRSTDSNTSRKKPVVPLMRKAMQWIHVISADDCKGQHHQSAIIIQRAWKRARVRSFHRSILESGTADGWNADVAWKGGTNVCSTTENSALTKRSAVTSQKKSPTHSDSKFVNSEGKRQFSGQHMALVKTNSGAKLRNESQVGTAMRELTGQRVAIGIIIALYATVGLTYTEYDARRAYAMILLHTQTTNQQYASRSLAGAKNSSIPDLYYYKSANGEIYTWPNVEHGATPNELRPRERYCVSVTDSLGKETIGMFSFRDERYLEALVNLLLTFFILFVWFFGVTAFAGPVMVLVVIPIERMVRLLGMLMMDPLGYENTSKYKQFIAEEDMITKNTQWTKEVLKGMETSFLMSTILRIGSMMKVGFGSAGVEIIRNNLQKGQNNNTLILNSQGSQVSCIFLFCDIRQFTDATECLQEEVFVFTNRIAAVVHSICHSYGGSANKNIGDAFLLSWLLEENSSGNNSCEEKFKATKNQGDKALLSVVKICMALHYDNYYMDAMSDIARDALLAKLSKRKGPVVQLGFGLHAGQAVQGAIGSQRKIDATYVSEHVERAEFLETSTKKYGVQMCMSDSFHRLLHPSNQRRCRKIDQIIIRTDDNDDDDDEDIYESGRGTIVELLTFDMDIDALWKVKPKRSKADIGNEYDSDIGLDKMSKREVTRLSGSRQGRQISANLSGVKEPNSDFGDILVSVSSATQADVNDEHTPPPELVLPIGPALYSPNVWLSEDIRRIRQMYSDGLFFQNFNSGLKSYYAKDWKHARQCFTTILENFEDGPSRYFLNQIKDEHCVPPRNFKPYGKA